MQWAFILSGCTQTVKAPEPRTSGRASCFAAQCISENCTYHSLRRNNVRFIIYILALLRHRVVEYGYDINRWVSVICKGCGRYAQDRIGVMRKAEDIYPSFGCLVRSDNSVYHKYRVVI